MTDLEQAIDEVISKEGEWLMQQQGVRGFDNSFDTGGKPCLRVFSDGASQETKQQITSRVRKVPVQFIETGAVRSKDA
jgi:hypothetical protein